MSGLPRLGFVGVGAIAEALITGMCTADQQRATFLLSPRNEATAKRLAGRFADVKVARDNQAVIDGSDIVFLAIRPQIAEEVLAAVQFKPGHRIVSLIATFDQARLRRLVAPVSDITRLLPLPSVAQHLGPLTLCPPVPDLAALLRGLGHLIQVESESELDALWAVTGLMGSYFGMLDGIATWLAQQGVQGDQIRPFVAAMFEALGATAAAQAEAGFDRLILDHSTSGGLNEQAWRELKSAGWTDRVAQALELIHARILGRATFTDRLNSLRDPP